MNSESFTTTYISWFTPDLFVLRKTVKNINFNEQLKSGQEFNFISKVLLETNQFKKLNKSLTIRRYSNDSIGVKRRKKKSDYLQTTFENSWITFNEIYPLSGFNRKFGKKYLLKCIRAFLEMHEIEKPSEFYKRIIEFYGIRSVNFFLALLSSRVLGKYYFFYSQLK